jgi:hypothetical protein
MRKGNIISRGQGWRARLQRARVTRPVFLPSLTFSLFFSATTLVAIAQEIPAGFQLDRYGRLWERNPFAPAAQANPRVQPSPFDKLFLTSWLKSGGGEVIFVQNSETNEVLRITREPGQNNLRLIELAASPDPLFVAAIISDGKEQGEVRFRCDFKPSAGEAPSVTTEVPNSRATRRVPTRPALAAETLPHLSANLSYVETASLPTGAPVQKIIPHPVYPGRPRVSIEGGTGPSLRSE